MRDKALFFVLWLIFSAICEWLASLIGPHFYFYVASVQAQEGQNAAAFILYMAVPIFVFVVMMLLFALFRFRARDDSIQPAKSQIKINKAYVGTWLGLSLVFNLFLFVHPTASAAQAYFNESMAYNKSPKTLIVDVVARQWEWRFSYPQYGLTQTVDANGNDFLELPVNTPVKFVLNSYDYNHYYDPQIDVIHSFWIPAFGMKMDVIPGETRTEYIEPTKISSTAQNQMLRVQCAEVCGPGHPYMEANMAVVSPANFAKWVAQQKKLEA